MPGRRVLAPCLTSRRSDRVETVLEHRRRPRLPWIEAVTPAYVPPNRTWDMEAWRVALASDAASRIPGDGHA